MPITISTSSCGRRKLSSRSWTYANTRLRGARSCVGNIRRPAIEEAAGVRRAPPALLRPRFTFLPPAIPSSGDRPPGLERELPAILEGGCGSQVHSCLVDGEAVCCVTSALAVFALLRHRMRPRETASTPVTCRSLDGQDLRCGWVARAIGARRAAHAGSTVEPGGCAGGRIA